MNKVLKFSATWCTPCLQMSKQIERLQEQLTNVSFVNIDIDASPEMISLHKVRSVPTLVKLDSDNIEIGRFSGSMIDAKLLEFLV